MMTDPTTRKVALGGIVSLVGSIAWLVYVAGNAIRPIQAPPIPGASAEEQRSDPVTRGWAIGRNYQPTLLTSHADSWTSSANQMEAGLGWDDVRDRWAGADRAWRDEPFDRVVQPEIARILGPDPDPARRRAATLFLRAFAAGLKDRR